MKIKKQLHHKYVSAPDGEKKFTAVSLKDKITNQKKDTNDKQMVIGYFWKTK